MSKTPLSRAKERPKSLEPLTKEPDDANVHGQSSSPLGLIDRMEGATDDRRRGRLSDSAWRKLVELLARLHEDDLGAALAVLRLRKRFEEESRRDASR